MSIPFSVRNEVFRMDDFTCVYCGYRGNDVVPDHFIPSSKGGPDIVDNLYTSCAPCNTRKRDKPIQLVGMSLRYGRFAYMNRETEAKELPIPAYFYSDWTDLFERLPRSMALTWMEVAQTLTTQFKSKMPRSAIWDYWGQECDIVPVMDRIVPGAFEELSGRNGNDTLADNSLIIQLERMASVVYLGSNCEIGNRIHSTADWRPIER